ncbi:MAG: Abi family protein [Rhodanobacteraceae bacterium]
MRYLKPALTFEEQLDLLHQRGLIVCDADRALHWLRNISYYRLSAYCLPFKDGDAFRPGIAFDDIAGLYIFDRKLRLLVLDAIERIEVAVRTAVTYEIAHAHGPFGHTDPANFAPGFDHARFMAAVSRTKPHFSTGDSGVDRMSIATYSTDNTVSRNQSSMIPSSMIALPERRTSAVTGTSDAPS